MTASDLEVLTNNRRGGSSPPAVDPGGRPGSVSLGHSALRHPFLVAGVIVIATVAGLAFGYGRQPTYKASTDLIVGKTVSLNNVAAVPGLATAGEEIASDYARLINTGYVRADVARRLGHPIDGTLSASAIAESPEILVEATSTTEGQARSIAAAGQAALVDGVNQVNQQTVTAQASLLQQYQVAARKQEQDSRQVTLLGQKLAQLQGLIGKAAPTATEQQQMATLNQQLVTEQTAVDIDQLQTSAIQGQYQSSYSPDQQAEQVITPLGSAVSNGSNRKSGVEIGGIVGVVGGIVVALALASLIETRRARRAWAAATVQPGANPVPRPELR